MMKMKKVLCLCLLMALLLLLTGCGPKNEEVSFADGKLVRNGIAYSEYQVFHVWGGDRLPDGVKPGRQIAVIVKNRETLHEIKGYLPEEWLISHFSDEMSNDYIIYKADHVEEIPAALALP